MSTRMRFNYPPLRVVQIVLGISHSLALLTTALRLFHRIHSRKAWWDDLWAALAMVVDALVLALYMATPRNLFRLPIATRIFWKLGTLVGYTFVLWAARISIAVTIVRLATTTRLRRVCKAAVWLFGVFFLALALGKVFMCGTNFRRLPTFPVPHWQGYLELSTDLIGDAWLIGAPAYMLWKSNLNSGYRYLIMAIFSCGIFTTAASIVHSYFILASEPFYIGFTGHIQLGVSILVCNLLVLITYIYRVFNNALESRSRTSSSKWGSVHVFGRGRTHVRTISASANPTTGNPTVHSNIFTTGTLPPRYSKVSLPSRYSSDRDEAVMVEVSTQTSVSRDPPRRPPRPPSTVPSLYSVVTDPPGLTSPERENQNTFTR